MRNLASPGFLLALTAMLVGASTSTAHAYLDPGRAASSFRSCSAGVAGLALACKLYWQKFVSMLGIKRKPEDLREIRQDQG